MGSKQVLDQGKEVDIVVGAARTNAKEIARRRAAQFVAAKVKHAPSAAEIEAGILADAALLEASGAALSAADDALTRELGDDAAVVVERDLRAESVHAILVEFRKMVQTNCGDVAVTEAGYVGTTPRDPAALQKLGGDVVRNVGEKPPRSVKKAVRFDAAAGIEGLDDEVKGLTKANADMRREKREEQTERAKRDEAWKVFDREHAAALRKLDGELRAVGLDDIADRLVPATPTSGGATGGGATGGGATGGATGGGTGGGATGGGTTGGGG